MSLNSTLENYEHRLLDGNEGLYVCDRELFRLLYTWNEAGEVDKDEVGRTVEHLYHFLSEVSLPFSTIEGYVGIYWFFKCLEAKGKYKDEAVLLPQLLEEINISLEENFRTFNLDPLYGIPAKVLAYTVSDSNDKLLQIVAWLEEEEQRLGTKKMFHAAFQEASCLGYAHGWPGVVAVLCQVYPRLHKPSAIWLYGFIDRISKKVLVQYRSQKTSSRQCLDEGEQVKYTERLGWCYGDFGLALMFKELAKIGIKGAQENMWSFLEATLGRDMGNAQINACGEFCDIGLCHGLSGLLYLNHHFAEYTGDQRFAAQADYWLSTIKSEYLKHGEVRAVIKHDKKYTTLRTPSFLEGGLGLALVLQSMRKPSLIPWKHTLMIYNEQAD